MIEECANYGIKGVPNVAYCQTSDISYNYIFILNLTPGFNRLGKDHSKRRQETFKFWDLVQLLLEVLWYAVIIYDEMRIEERQVTTHIRADSRFAPSQ